MSDGPISVPVTEDTPEQAEEREKGFRQSDLMTELVGQLKPKSAAMLQTAHSLEKEATKDQLQALVDEIDQVAQAGRNAHGRLDELDCSKESFTYKAIHNLWEYADLAIHDAKQARDAAGDNEEVRNVAFGNMMQNLEHADGQIQQA